MQVLAFLLDLFKYNENSKNRYSDCYYRRALIDALAETVTPVVSVVLNQSSSKVWMGKLQQGHLHLTNLYDKTKIII